MDLTYLTILWDRCQSDRVDAETFVKRYSRVIRAATGVDLNSPYGKNLSDSAKLDLIGATLRRLAEIRHLPSRAPTPPPGRRPFVR